MRIASRYSGPPGSANGGITCGRVAAYLAAPVAQVTLRRPPPLDTDLRVEVDSGEGTAAVRLWDGEHLVAEAVPGEVAVTPPAAVDVATAVAASRRYAGLSAHPFPGCFTCGTDREPPEALGLHPGPVGRDHVAAAWTPTGHDRALVWAALDCPGGWATDLPGRPMVLGRMSLRLDAEPVPGVEHVVQGWVERTDGRKTHCGTSLRDAEGRLLAVAQQTWIAVELEQVGRQG